jgi:uncharacterized membrane protein YecN with MAPEG domain
MAIAFVPMLSPWVGGIVARLLTAEPWRIGLVGVVLWFASSTSLWYLHRPQEVARARGLGATILVWTLTFIPMFAIGAIATGMVIGHS